MREPSILGFSLQSSLACCGISLWTCQQSWDWRVHDWVLSKHQAGTANKEANQAHLGAIEHAGLVHVIPQVQVEGGVLPVGQAVLVRPPLHGFWGKAIHIRR